MASVQGIYLALFGRPADPAGLSYFNSITNNGTNLAGISNLSGQAEYISRFAGMNNTQIVTTIYQSLFGRAPEQAGLDFFVGQLASGKIDINQVAINILDGAAGDDKLVVEAKIAAANLFTSQLDLPAEVAAYSGSAAADIARAYINSINATKVGTGPDVDAMIQTLMAAAGQTPGADDGTGQPSAPDFHAILTKGVVTFTGSALGDITLGESGVFSRGGIAASETIDDVKDMVLAPSADQMLVLTAEQASNQGVEGEGSVEITDLGSVEYFLAKIKTKGTAYVEEETTLHENTVLSASVAVDVAKDQALTLTTAQANNVTIQGEGNTNVFVSIKRDKLGAEVVSEKAADASPSLGNDTITVLTTGKNIIETGAGADTVVAGDGDDTIYAQDGWAKASDGTHYVIGDLGGHKGEVFYSINGAGLRGPVLLSFENKDGSEETAEKNFVDSFNTDERFSGKLTASHVTEASGSHVQISTSDPSLPVLKIEPVVYDSDSFTFQNPSNLTSGSILIGNSDLGIYTMAIGSGSPLTTKNIADMINASGLTNYVSVSVEGDTITMTWKTPGLKVDMSVSSSGLSISDVSHANPTTPDVSLNYFSVDTFTGGGGNDVFVFNASTVKATDVILDFDANTDKIQFEGRGPALTFAKMESVGGTLAEAVDFILQNHTDINKVVSFDNDDKTYLLLDSNGNKVFDEGIDQLINITGHTGTLDSGDFSYTETWVLP